MDDFGKPERPEQNCVRRATEFEVGLRVDDAGTRKSPRAGVDRFNDEACSPSIASLLQDVERRVDNFLSNPVARQADQSYVDHLLAPI